MKTLGEAALDLPWIAPSVASVTALARQPLESVWMEVRTDPGALLLSAQLPESSSLCPDIAILETLLRRRADFQRGFCAWNQPGAAAVHTACFRLATLASHLAELAGVDSRQAWVGGFLAPLGWLAAACVAPEKLNSALPTTRRLADSPTWQAETWGCDHTAVARRLSRNWRLPAWLSVIIGHVGIHVSIAERLGANRRLFAIVQLAVSLTQEEGKGLGLPVAAEQAELVSELNLKNYEVEKLADAALAAVPPSQGWESPARQPLLIDLLEMALEKRRRDDARWIERLQLDQDRMEAALVQQSLEENNRLQAQKMAALAEFAAGAGHEINNPLAVISGQAQYVLKQLSWLDVPAEEIEDVGLYLEGLRDKIEPSLKKVIGQTQRIHMLLTDLMQFARPAPPRLQTISARGLVLEVANGLEALAQQRHIRLLMPTWDQDEYLHVDASQARHALTALVRNALESAPAEGWVRVGIDKPSKQALELIVEDNGPGPCSKGREHLFDPFFSGKSAGRGRGLGLPIAWRFARQQGGDVRFDGAQDGVTRFVLALPLAQTPNYVADVEPPFEPKPRHVSPSLQGANT